jgi:hypothetical protein
VEAFLYGGPENLPPDAEANHYRWQSPGQSVVWTRSIEYVLRPL